MRLTNHLNLPAPLVRAMENDGYVSSGSDYSVTTLNGPARLATLRRRHWEELEEDASDRIWALLGQGLHACLERAATGKHEQAEQYIRFEIDGVTIGGRLDLVHVEDGVLSDYKLTSVWSGMAGLKDEWIAQASVYRYGYYLATGTILEKAEIVCIYRDWSQKRSLEPGYPDLQVQVFQVPLWNSNKTRAYLRQRIAAHRAAEEELPACTPEERWARPDQWAVMRRKRKRALRVLDSYSSAATWAHEHDHRLETDSPPGDAYIQHRPGESVRCASYCPVSTYCSQWAADPMNPVNQREETQ